MAKQKAVAPTREHTLTELDFKNNPELSEKGLKVGDLVNIPLTEEEIKALEGSGGAEVIAEFRDMENFDTVYTVGEDVSHFTPERIAILKEQGLVK